MKTLTLTRLWQGSHGTFGRLAVEGTAFAWWTVERPATGDHPAIPAATYPLVFGMHHAGQADAYPCYWVEDVPHRHAIQIHVANRADQLQGCIAPGRTMEMLRAPTGLWVPGVGGSGDAFAALMRTMNKDIGEIVIHEEF